MRLRFKNQHQRRSCECKHMCGNTKNTLIYKFSLAKVFHSTRLAVLMLIFMRSHGINNAYLQHARLPHSLIIEYYVYHVAVSMDTAIRGIRFTRVIK